MNATVGFASTTRHFGRIRKDDHSGLRSHESKYFQASHQQEGGSSAHHVGRQSSTTQGGADMIDSIVQGVLDTASAFFEQGRMKEAFSCIDQACQVYQESNLHAHEKARGMGKCATLKQEFVEKDAARTIERSYKKFRQHLDTVKPSQYGMRHVVHPETKEEFYISPKHHTFTPARDRIQGGASGGHKQVVGINANSVTFKHHEPEEFDYSSVKIEEILTQLGVESYLATMQVSEVESVARNAGSRDLRDSIENGQRFLPRQFAQVLHDTKKLHKEGYFHLDLKPENTMVSDGGTLKVVDLDALSSFGKVSGISTPRYTTRSLDGNTQNASRLKAKDEFALALTMMEASGISLDDITDTVTWGGEGHQYAKPRSQESLSKKVQQFIESYIRPEYVARFTMLLTDPQQYVETSDDGSPYLYDMFFQGDGELRRLVQLQAINDNRAMPPAVKRMEKARLACGL